MQQPVIDTSSSLVTPRAAMALDTQALSAFLAKLGDGATSSTVSALQQFSHGQSNPTYLLTLGDGRKLVLRKKPPGQILASAHAVEREYKVLDALARGSSVPVPRPVTLCTDSGVVGTPFYLMEYAQGHIYLDPNLPTCDPPLRSHLYRQMAHTLAALHAAQPDRIGLAGYGEAGHYCARQLKRWGAQYAASRRAGAGAPALPEVERLLGWLAAHVPAEDAAPPRPAIVHGDYRLDNLVFTPPGATSRASGAPATNASGAPQLAAVLDWELSTLGNPWSDVAYNCMPYHLPDMPVLKKLGSGAGGGLAAGIPGEAEYVAWYCQAAGVSPPSPQDWSFYLALSLFRLLAILAGVQARAQQGNASSAHAVAVSSDAVLRSLAHAALAIIARSEAEAQRPPSPSSPTCYAASFEAAAAPRLIATTSTTPSATSAFLPTTSTSTLVAAATAGSGAKGGSSSSSNGGLGGGTGVAGPAQLPPRVRDLLARLNAFMREHVYPAEDVFEAHAVGPDRWTVHPLMEQLKAKAKAAGLWNLWLPAPLAAKVSYLQGVCAGLQGDAAAASDAAVLLGGGLTNWEYAHLCEVMGRSVWAPEVFNCGAPDTGNMEVLAKYGSRAQQEAWLLPLLRGTIRSCFAMTEKAVASSDATNIEGVIEREGGALVVSGVKWWTSGACDPRCAVAIFMGKTRRDGPPHKQQSMVLVPMSAPGVRMVRPMLVFGYDDAPHGHAEVHFDRVRVPADALILGEGRGFEIAQGRLGPGRLHHCMRLVGAGERALEIMAARALQRSVFGGPIADQGAFQASLAQCRIELDGARLLVRAASAALDEGGFKGARGAIAVAKVAAPNAVQRIVDAAMQVHGGAGVSQDTPLARLWTAARTLRIADGPDEVHLGTIAKLELSAAKKRLAAAGAQHPASKL